MLYEAIVAAGDLGRLNEIAGVVIRHGFGQVVTKSGLLSWLKRTGTALNWTAAAEMREVAAPERARRMLEELGPTFVKLGQVLASRTDLLPPEWTDEFSNLHARVQSLEFEELQAQLEEDLGKPVDEAFAAFDRKPLAAGSIGQVHCAVLHDGREVIVKIRRPGIQAKVEADLRLLRHIAELLESEVSELRRYRPVRVQRQFARSIKAELNFVVEAKNLRAIQKNLPIDTELETPEMVWDYSCERLLVQTRLPGISASDWMKGKRDGAYDTPAIAAVGADAILRMVFIDGVYHADPHPGNIILSGGRRVGLLDFGMVGRLSENRRREFAELLKGVADRDVTAVAEVLLSWADSGTVDFELLQQDCEAFLDRYSGVQLKDLDVAGLLLDLSSIMRENDLAFPADVSMLIKVFVTLEGLGRALHPQFDLSAHLEPLAKELVRKMGSPRAILRRGARDIARIMAGLPHDVRVTLDRIRRGNFKIELDLERLDSFGHQLDRSANRVTVGMILASMIIGTSIAMTIDAGPKLWGMPAIGLFGFVTSAATSAGLLWSIFRSGKHR